MKNTATNRAYKLWPLLGYKEMKVIENKQQPRQKRIYESGHSSSAITL
jgi:hypothetical protein